MVTFITIFFILNNNFHLAILLVSSILREVLRIRIEDLRIRNKELRFEQETDTYSKSGNILCIEATVFILTPAFRYFWCPFSGQRKNC